MRCSTASSSWTCAPIGWPRRKSELGLHMASRWSACRPPPSALARCSCLCGAAEARDAPRAHLVQPHVQAARPTKEAADFQAPAVLVGGRHCADTLCGPGGRRRQEERASLLACDSSGAGLGACSCSVQLPAVSIAHQRAPEGQSGAAGRSSRGPSSPACSQRAPACSKRRNNLLKLLGACRTASRCSAAQAAPCLARSPACGVCEWVHTRGQRLGSTDQSARPC